MNSIVNNHNKNIKNSTNNIATNNTNSCMNQTTNPPNTSKFISPYIPFDDNDIEFYIRPKARKEKHDSRSIIHKTHRNPLRRFKIDSLKEEVGSFSHNPHSKDSFSNRIPRPHTTNDVIGNNNGNRNGGRMNYKNTNIMKDSYVKEDSTFITMTGGNTYTGNGSGINNPINNNYTEEDNPHNNNQSFQFQPKPYMNETSQYGKAYLFKKHNLRKSIDCMSKKYNSTSFVEIARGISRERKKRDSSYHEDREVDTRSVINSLRSIHQSNLVKANIEDCNNLLTTSYKYKMIEYESIHHELLESKSRIEVRMNTHEKELRTYIERNKEMQMKLNSVEKDYNIENNRKKGFEHQIFLLQQEIITFESCYDFVVQLLPTDLQKSILDEIDIFWEEQLIQHNSRLIDCKIDYKKDRENAINYLKTNFKINYTNNYPPNVDIELNYPHLMNSYNQVYQDIQSYLIKNDELRDKISEINKNYNTVYAQYEEDFNKQKHNYEVRVKILDNLSINKSENLVSLFENEELFIKILKEVYEWVEQNAYVFTNGMKQIKGMDKITHKEAVDFCMLSEQVIETYLNMIKYEKQTFKYQNEDSFVKQFNNCRKVKNLVKTVDNKLKQKLNHRKSVLSMTSEVSIKNLRPMQRSKPKDHGKQRMIMKEEREERLDDYLDKD